MDYKKMKRKELKTECKKKGIKGYSKLKKDVLINLLENFPNIQEKYKKKIKKKKIKKKKIKKKTKTLDIDMNINTPKIIEIFYSKYTKPENDKLNKLREKMITKILNDENYYKIFINTEYYSNFNTLSHGLKREIARYSKKVYKFISVQIKAGRKFNYDFLFKYLNKDGQSIDDIKVEFKYGVTTLTKYPEIYSKYTKGASIFNNKDYIEFFYLKLDDLIETFPDEEAEELKKHKPKNLTKYKKMINSTTYKHPFQNIIYNYDKKMNDKKNLKHKRFVNDTIKDFLKSITDADINFEKWREELVSKQKDKYFLLCKDGIWYTERLTKEIMITKEWKIKNGNMIVFECENPKYQLQCLLRWKNHKGCAGPAWQVKLHKKRLRK
jgi:hypothetical protein